MQMEPISAQTFMNTCLAIRKLQDKFYQLLDHAPRCIFLFTSYPSFSSREKKSARSNCYYIQSSQGTQKFFDRIHQITTICWYLHMLGKKNRLPRYSASQIRRMFVFHNIDSNAIAAIFAGGALSFETQSRQTQIALYCLNKAM